jgi:hypothetical protein
MIADSLVQEAAGEALIIPRLSYHGIFPAVPAPVTFNPAPPLHRLPDEIPKENAPLLPLCLWHEIPLPPPLIARFPCLVPSPWGNNRQRINVS